MLMNEFAPALSWGRCRFLALFVISEVREHRPLMQPFRNIQRQAEV